MFAINRKAIRAEAERIHIKDKLEKISFAKTQSVLLGHTVAPAKAVSLTRCSAMVWHEVCRRSREDREKVDGVPRRSRQTMRFDARKAAKADRSKAARLVIATRRQKQPALAA